MYIDPFSIIQSVSEQSHFALKVNANTIFIKIDRTSHTTTTTNKQNASKVKHTIKELVHPTCKHADMNTIDDKHVTHTYN